MMFTLKNVNIYAWKNSNVINCKLNETKVGNSIWKEKFEILYSIFKNLFTCLLFVMYADKIKLIKVNKCLFTFS